MRLNRGVGIKLDDLNEMEKDQLKSIKDYQAPKYATPGYEKIAEGIYRTEGQYVTSLSFQIEPDFGEGASASQLAQYPLEVILDEYNVYISDFYPELNTSTSLQVYLEFAGVNVEDIKGVLKLVNHRVICQTFAVNGEECLELLIDKEESFDCV